MHSHANKAYVVVVVVACLHLWLQVFLCQVDKTLQFKCVVPENIQTPTMEGTLLRTPHLPGFSIFAGN